MCSIWTRKNQVGRHWTWTWTMFRTPNPLAAFPTSSLSWKPRIPAVIMRRQIWTPQQARKQWRQTRRQVIRNDKAKKSFEFTTLETVFENHIKSINFWQKWYFWCLHWIWIFAPKQQHFCQLPKVEFLARKIQIERLELRVIFKHCVRVNVFSQIRKDTEKFDDEKKLFTIGTFYQLAKKKIRVEKAFT